MPRPRLMLDLNASVAISEGCWEWLGKTSLGYGKTGELWAHRMVYTLLVGPISDGLELDHLCRNRSCVRPDHLEPVTHAENLRRALVQTHCRYGHELTGENLYVWKAKRQCRTCRERHELAWRRTHRAVKAARARAWRAARRLQAS